jgi:tRNA threonylcarbamoyladenosine biosynthesis protein TsaE
MVIQITTDSVEDTQQLGQKIGSLVNTGTVLALTGDLGSGKTAFVQGLARGLDVPDNYYITSPSFTLINEYPGRCKLFHVDLYRMGNIDDFEDIGIYEILEKNGVAAIEWADKLPEALLSEYVAIQFEISNENSRKICINAYGLEEINLLRKLTNCY